jgi:adenylate kinase
MPVADVDEADRFQTWVSREMLRHVAQETGPIVVDGHFVVPTLAGPAPVSPAIFQQLGFLRLFLLLADPNDVARRLSSRPTPSSWWDGRVESLAALQQMEEVHAQVVSEQTGIPLEILGASVEAELAIERELVRQAQVADSATRASKM